jgi:ribosomal-protein-serine acetyltransferase
VSSPRVILPERIEEPRGLVLRRWLGEDAPELGRAVEESVEHLRPWMAWIEQEPLPVERRRAMIEEWGRAWSEGGDVVLGAILDGRVAGGCGLHRRIGPHGLEIGYWTHSALLRRGLATRAAAMLTEAALGLPGITHVEIHHDRANRASAGVPSKLGFQWLGEVADDPEAPGDIGIEWRWRMDRERWRRRTGA